mgnify:CR=1 FL=1
MDIFNLAVSNLMQIFYFIWSVLCAISAIFGLNMHWSLESGVILKSLPPQGVSSYCSVSTTRVDYPG